MTEATPIRVLIADDNADVRNALAALIDHDAELELAASAGDAAEAVELAARERPHVALLDVRMPAGGAVAAVRGIATRSPETKVILLSASGVVPEGLDDAVSGCIAKGISIPTLLDSLKQAGRDAVASSGSPTP